MKYIISNLLFLMAISFTSCGQKAKVDEGTSYNYEVQKTEEEWKTQLSTLEYDVLRNEETERAFTGKYVDWKKEGTFVCNACKNEVFSSSTKFKSGTGWPSFYQPINEGAILEKKDTQYGWNRVEIECQRCGSHLGHVFDDGPEPTGLRYCINSVSLDFKEAK